MRGLLPVLAALILSACSDPRLSAGLSLGANGLSVTPSVSGTVGDGTVSFTP
jgi:hypothetical protein